MSAQELYEATARYLRETGWLREQDGSGWWWKEDATSDLTMADAVDEQLHSDGVDTRVMYDGEPRVFYDGGFGVTDREQLIAKARRWMLFIDRLDSPTVAEQGGREIIEGLLAELEAERSD